jgi:hypothetical protein
MTASRLLLLLTTFLLITGCNSGKKSEAALATNDTLPTTTSEVKQVFEILLDTIYNNKNYKIVQEYHPDALEEDNSHTNTIFTLLKLGTTNTEVLFKDTVYSRTGEIEFRDFNGDQVKDILVQNYSDVRSNWTYNLYVVDTTGDRLTKIKGFNEVKNPRYLPQHDLIDNFVMSGTNWTSFYKIQGDSVKDYNIIIYEDLADEGKYERAYNKAIARIKRSKADR